MKYIGKVLLAALAYVVGIILTGMVAPLLHFPAIHAPAGIDLKHGFLMTVLASPLLTIAVSPLASGMRGSWYKRCLAIAALLFVAIGLNTVMELLIFSTLYKGGTPLVSVHWVLPGLLSAAILAWSFSAQEKASTVQRLPAQGWAWRVFVAWLSFPFFYYLFGMCVAPFVIQYYNSFGSIGLVIPAQKVIFSTQLVRSALFLAASMPAVFLWAKSRGQFILAMGLAHAFAVGIFQLVQADFLPTILRVAHSVEITADSFGYATVLGILFIAKSSTGEDHSRDSERCAVGSAVN